jgi:hypothetical protein
MANNPYVNKVIYGNDTVMDITDTTAEEGYVVTGKTFYMANGARSTGRAVIPDISNCYQTTDTAETDIQDTDCFPFYDTSATAKRKTLWSNIKAKLKAYFDTVYATLASPAFTGTPTAPTATRGTDTTQLATTAFVQSAGSSKYDLNDPYLSDLSDTYTYVPVLDTTGMYATKRTSWQNVKQTLAADLSAVFLVRTSVTATAGSEIRIPASGTSPYLGGDPYIEPVCDTGLGRGVKYSEIWLYGGSNNEGYVKIKLAEAISGSTIGVKIIRR